MFTLRSSLVYRSRSERFVLVFVRAAVAVALLALRLLGPYVPAVGLVRHFLEEARKMLALSGYTADELADVVEGSGTFPRP